MTDQELKDLVAGLAANSERIDRQMEKTDRQMERNERKLNELGVLVGGISHNNGFYSETFFQDAFEEKLEFNGEKYDGMHPNFGCNDKRGKIDIDVMLINGKSIALIEVKYMIHPNNVKELAEERVKKFRAIYPEFDNYKIYLGIAGFSFPAEALETAKKYGVGIVKPGADEDDVEEVKAERLKAY